MTTLTKHDIEIGDRLVLRDDACLAAEPGAIGTYTGDGMFGHTIYIEWDREVNELSKTQTDGGYIVARFEKHVEPDVFTVEDPEGLRALPEDTILRLDFAHLTIRKTAEDQYMWVEKSGNEYRCHVTAENMKGSEGWFPMTIENPEILGEFKPVRKPYAGWAKARERLTALMDPTIITTEAQLRDLPRGTALIPANSPGCDSPWVVLYEDDLFHEDFTLGRLNRFVLRPHDDRQLQGYDETDYVIREHLGRGDSLKVVYQPA